MDVFLPDAVCGLRLIAFRYLPICEARNSTEPFYCAVRSGGSQSLLVRVNDQTLTLLLRLRFLYSREHIQAIVHSLYYVRYMLENNVVGEHDAVKPEDGENSTLRNVGIFQIVYVSCQNTLILVADAETSCIRTQDVGCLFTHVSYPDRPFFAHVSYPDRRLFTHVCYLDRRVDMF